MEIRGIRIDKTARRVYINGEEKAFTTKEFDLLTFLAENPNHVFTKEELFREIWDMDSIGDIATVTVHIKKIREKIEADTANPQYIETIWGVGYRFKAVSYTHLDVYKRQAYRRNNYINGQKDRRVYGIYGQLPEAVKLLGD